MSDIHFGKHEQNQHLFQMNISMKPSKIHLMVIIIQLTEKLRYHKTVNLHHPCQLGYHIIVFYFIFSSLPCHLLVNLDISYQHSRFSQQRLPAAQAHNANKQTFCFCFILQSLFVLFCFLFYFLLSLFARQLGYHISHPGSVKKGYQLDKLTMQSSKLLLLF